jgi:hypothetical protein
MDHEMNRLLHERELRKLISEYAQAPLIRTILALDLAIRRAAWRALASQPSRSEGSSMSRSTPGSSTS